MINFASCVSGRDLLIIILCTIILFLLIFCAGMALERANYAKSYRYRRDSD